MYRRTEIARLSIGRENKIVIAVIIFTLLVLILSVLCVLDLTYRSFSLAWLGKNMTQRVDSIIELITGSGAAGGIKFFLTEFLAIGIVGAALSCSGTIYQGAFQNPMASPTILGVQSGGLLGKAVYTLFFTAPATTTVVVKYEDMIGEYMAQSIFDRYMGQFFVLFGCFFAVALIIAIAKAAGRGKIDTVALILAGTVFSTVITSAVTALQYVFSPFSATQGSTSLTNASFTSVTDPQVLVLMAVPIIVCLIISVLLSGKLNILAFGEEEAKAMGINVHGMRLFLIVISTVMTAVVIAFCGQIAFVGLIIPHIARRIIGPDYRKLMIATAFLGAAFLIIVFDITYSIGMSLSISNITNTVGGLVFLVIMSMYRRNRNGDWA